MRTVLLVACGCDGDAAPDDTADPGPAEVQACDGATVLAPPADPAAPGPWPVGARTVEVGRLTVEVWYPAEPGSEVGAEPIDYDIRYALPASQQALIGDDVAPSHRCDCARDLPLDARYGPYPVVVFLHGTAAWRSQSLTEVTHWASRGFVVLAADHPGLWLADALTIACPDEPTGAYDVAGDVDAMLAAVAAGDGGLAFLQGAVDLDHVGLAGHSAGGGSAAALAARPGVRAVVSLAAGGPPAAGASLATTLFMGALEDGVVPYEAVIEGYEQTAGPKRLVGISNTGHLAFSDICEIRNGAGDDMLEIAEDAGVCGAAAASLLFDCDPSFLDAEPTHTIVKAATGAALEGALHCADRSAVFEGLQADYPDVAEVRSESGR